MPGSNWAPVSRWWFCWKPMLGFQPCVVEIGGQFPEKWWGVVVCQATILWVQLRERGQEKEIKLDAASLITGWNCGCFWFLGFFFTGRMVNKKRCEKLLQWETILDAGAITCAVTPTDLLRLHHLLHAWGRGRRLTGASLLKSGDAQGI